MKKYAVIVAGGAGLRMGSVIPKQFLLLHGKPVLWYTLDVFLRSYDDMEIILVAPREYMGTAGELVRNFPDAAGRIQVVCGGATRFHSVQNGLSVIREASVIFVHDGVRCLLSADLVRYCYAQALQHGSAIPVIDSRDSVRLVTAAGNEAVDRSRIKLVQTPQTFLSDILLPAYQLEYKDHFTDEATVVESFGRKIHLVEGEVNNIKITTPADLAVAESLIV